MGVVWYDEANGEYVLQEQAVIDYDENKIVMELTHFSIYSLIDRLSWGSISEISYNYPTYWYEYDRVTEGCLTFNAIGGGYVTVYDSAYNRIYGPNLDRGGIYDNKKYLLIRVNTLGSDMDLIAGAYGGTPLVINNSREAQFINELVMSDINIWLGVYLEDGVLKDRVTGEEISYRMR